MKFLKSLFSTTGLLIGVYILVGVFVNTAAPHLPSTAGGVESLHSWVQYAISVMFWPLSFWNPNFTVGKWIP
jgi:hypothetical protein